MILIFIKIFVILIHLILIITIGYVMKFDIKERNIISIIIELVFIITLVNVCISMFV